MSAVEKEAKEPENGDKENGENEEDRQSGNFLDPKKVSSTLLISPTDKAYLNTYDAADRIDMSLCVRSDAPERCELFMINPPISQLTCVCC